MKDEKYPISKELSDYYRALLDWIDEGQPKNNKHAFKSFYGLCQNIENCGNPDLIDSLLCEQRIIFKFEGFLSQTFPFNPESSTFYKESDTETTYSNPIRLAFIQKYATKKRSPVNKLPKTKITKTALNLHRFLTEECIKTLASEFLQDTFIIPKSFDWDKFDSLPAIHPASMVIKFKYFTLPEAKAEAERLAQLTAFCFDFERKKK